MNWDMVGAIGEVLGAGGVILTLGYLAIQIKASARQDRLRAGREAMDRTSDFVKVIAESDGAARVWLRGVAGASDMTPEEQARFGALALHLTDLRERVHLQSPEGNIDPYLIQSTAASRREIAASPGYRKWYATRSHWLSQESQEVLDREVRGEQTYVPFGVAEHTVAAASRHRPTDPPGGAA